MSFINTVKAITVGQLLICTPIAASIGGGALWGLNVMIKQAVAGEKFATQEALDEQKVLLQQLQKDLTTQSRDQAIIQSDVGTVKQLQKENRDDIKEILRGIANLNN